MGRFTIRLAGIALGKRVHFPVLMAFMASCAAGGAALTQSSKAAVNAPEPLPPELKSNLVRLHETVMFGVPAPYRDMHESGGDDPRTLQRGAMIFRTNCAACHGMSGRGDGPISGYQAAPPANLAWLSVRPMNKTYAYMYWVIAEGGADYGSDMPPFKTTLPKRDIAAVISYVQSGPSPPASPPTDSDDNDQRLRR